MVTHATHPAASEIKAGDCVRPRWACVQGGSRSEYRVERVLCMGEYLRLDDRRTVRADNYRAVRNVGTSP